MGYAVATAAAEAGADVTLISGPVNIDATGTIKVINVTSTEQMHQSVMQKISSTDIFISDVEITKILIPLFANV